MKSINFINPIPPHKQRALAYWLYGSGLLMCLIMLCFGTVYVQRLRVYNSLVHEVNDLKKVTVEFEKVVEQKQALLQKKKMLEERLHILNTFAHATDAPHMLLGALASLTPANICLTVCEARPGKLICLEGLAYDTKAVTEFLEILNVSPLFAEIKLCLLAPAQEIKDNRNLLRFKLEGIWKITEINPSRASQS